MNNLIRCFAIATVLVSSWLVVPTAEATEPVHLQLDLDEKAIFLFAEDGSVQLHLDIFSSATRSAYWAAEPAVSLGWKISIVDDDKEESEPSAFFPSDGLGMLPTLALRVEPDPTTTNPEPDQIVVQVWFSDLSQRHRLQSKQLYFAVDSTGLVPVTYDDYLQAVTFGDDQSPELAVGQDVLTPTELEHLPPWNNPDLSEEEKAASAAIFGVPGDAQASGLDTVSDKDQAAAPMAMGPDEDGLSKIPLALGTSEGSGTASISVALASVVPSTIGWILFGLAFLGLLLLWRNPIARKVLVFAAVAVTVWGMSSEAMAETRWFYGYVAFWDTREGRSDDTGSRFLECDDEDYNCSPGSADCCWTKLPYVEMSLYRGSTSGTKVDTYRSTLSGYFALRDTEWEDVNYYVKVQFENDGAPAALVLTSQYGSSGWIIWKGPYQLDSTYNYVSNLNMNSAGDEVSLAGSIASVWDTSQLTFKRLEYDGETRYRRLCGSEEDYDLITMRMYDSGSSTAGCASSVKIDDDRYRTGTPAHELGHITHGRVVGCNPGIQFPEPYDGWNNCGSESGVLGEAIADLVRNLWYWNPASALPASLPACNEAPGSCNYANDCAAQENNMRGLWEFIDTPTSGGDAYQDYVNLTVEDLFDALLPWMDSDPDFPDCESSGVNRTSCEREYPFTYHSPLEECSECSDDCDEGDTCLYKTWDDYYCYYGEVHGCNVRDWLYHLADEQGGSEEEYWKTLQHSACVGAGDNSYPFTGGYRTD